MLKAFLTLLLLTPVAALAQLGHHGFVVPAAGADEVLHGLAGAAGLGGDGLGGLALQAAELALQDHLGR